VFVRYLNTSVSTVQKWQTGEKRPSGAVLKLLDAVSRHGMDVLAHCEEGATMTADWNDTSMTKSSGNAFLDPAEAEIMNTFV